jgi:ABC-type multidrug transport system ATPase subunit
LAPSRAGCAGPVNAMPEPVLCAEGLAYAIGPRALFSGLSLQLPPGVSLVRGGDGRGKTSLLALLAGALPAQRGTLNLRGTDLALQPEAYRAQVFLTQPASGALDAISPDAWFDALAARHPGFDREAVDELADGLALGPHREKPGYMLSAGTKRKVWLAGALASGAALTLLDEPFAALDKASIGFVLDLLEEAAASSTRAWVLADYQPPPGVPLAAVIDLGD